MAGDNTVHRARSGSAFLLVIIEDVVGREVFTLARWTTERFADLVFGP